MDNSARTPLSAVLADMLILKLPHVPPFRKPGVHDLLFEAGWVVRRIGMDDLRTRHNTVRADSDAEASPWTCLDLPSAN